MQKACIHPKFRCTHEINSEKVVMMDHAKSLSCTRGQVCIPAQRDDVDEENAQVGRDILEVDELNWSPDLPEAIRLSKNRDRQRRKCSGAQEQLIPLQNLKQQESAEMPDKHTTRRSWARQSERKTARVTGG